MTTSRSKAMVFPRLAHQVLREIAVYAEFSSDLESLTMEGALSQITDAVVDAPEAHAAITANLAAGYLSEAAPGFLVVTPEGLAVMRAGGPFPRLLADGCVIDA